MDFEIKSSGSGYIVYNIRGLLKVESQWSTVTGMEGNDIETKTNMLVVVAKAIFIRDTCFI